MAAPSAAASDPWEFVVVTEPERLAALRKRLLFGRYEAPAAVVVCGNTAVAHNSAARHYWLQDCSAAMENLHIAASGLGLGAVWIGLYPHEAAQAAVRQVLTIPEGVVPMAGLYVVPPSDASRTRYDAPRVLGVAHEPRAPAKEGCRTGIGALTRAGATFACALRVEQPEAALRPERPTGAPDKRQGGARHKPSDAAIGPRWVRPCSPTRGEAVPRQVKGLRGGAPQPLPPIGSRCPRRSRRGRRPQTSLVAGQRPRRVARNSPHPGHKCATPPHSSACRRPSGVRPMRGRWL